MQRSRKHDLRGESYKLSECDFVKNGPHPFFLFLWYYLSYLDCGVSLTGVHIHQILLNSMLYICAVHSR